MATSSCPGGNFDVVCCVCRDNYKDPKTLPCGHSYCSECLIKHIKSRFGERDVLCPKCRQPIQIPRDSEEIESWVLQLKTDKRITNMLLAKTERQRGCLKRLVPTLQIHEVSSVTMKGKVSSTTLETVDLPTSDPFLPLLKQIGDTFSQIWEHVTTKGEFAIYPKTVHGVASQISDSIFSRVGDISGGKFGLSYVAKSLAPVVNIESDVEPPPGVLCDVCIMTSVRSTMILTLQEDTSQEDTSQEDQEEDTVKYNHALSRGITEAVLDFTDENFTVVNGVLKVSDLQDKESFCRRIEAVEKNSTKYCVSDSLTMTETKCLNIVTAFLRAVAVVRNTEVFAQKKGYEELWFLTKEQFVVLTENISSCAVFVDAVSSSGSTVLMVEVANRLEKTGKTMLIRESSQTTPEAREVCSMVTSGKHVSEDAIPSDICNIVAEATVIENLQMTGRSFKHVWVFHSKGCSMCDGEGRETSAATWCEDCDLFLCKEHAHNHPLVPMGGGITQPGTSLCLKHTNKELEMYCADCNVAVCYICCQTKHSACQNIKYLAD